MYSLILHGRRRLVQLQKWRHLGVSGNSLQDALSNSFSSAGASCRDSRGFTVSYLVDSLGFSSKLAESISKKVSIEDNNANLDSVVNLFRRYGFSDSQISTIIMDYPLLLIHDAKKSLAPKLQFLLSRGGASTSGEFTQIVSKVPKILGKRVGETISRYYDFVKVIIQADKSPKLDNLSHSLPEGSYQENKIRNLLVLRELGMPQKLLFSLLVSNSGSICGKQRFQESLNKVVQMGFDPTTPMFVQALNSVYRLSDKTIEEKVDVYKSLGFIVDDVWAVFKKWPISMTLSERNILNSVETFLGLGFTRDEFVKMVKGFPQCMGYSAETVKIKTEFVVKQMKWPVQAVAMFPQSLGYNMEKRIVPRCSVIKALVSKRLFRDKGSVLPSLSSVLACADQTFLNKYVVKHDNKELVAELMAIFTRHRAS